MYSNKFSMPGLYAPHRALVPQEVVEEGIKRLCQKRYTREHAGEMANNLKENLEKVSSQANSGFNRDKIREIFLGKIDKAPPPKEKGNQPIQGMYQSGRYPPPSQSSMSLNTSGKLHQQSRMYQPPQRSPENIHPPTQPTHSNNNNQSLMMNSIPGPAGYSHQNTLQHHQPQTDERHQRTAPSSHYYPNHHGLSQQQELQPQPPMYTHKQDQGNNLYGNYRHVPNQSSKALESTATSTYSAHQYNPVPHEAPAAPMHSSAASSGTLSDNDFLSMLLDTKAESGQQQAPAPPSDINRRSQLAQQTRGASMAPFSPLHPAPMAQHNSQILPNQSPIIMEDHQLENRRKVLYSKYAQNIEQMKTNIMRNLKTVYEMRKRPGTRIEVSNDKIKQFEAVRQNLEGFESALRLERPFTADIADMIESHVPRYQEKLLKKPSQQQPSSQIPKMQNHATVKSEHSVVYTSHAPLTVQSTATSAKRPHAQWETPSDFLPPQTGGNIQANCLPNTSRSMVNNLAMKVNPKPINPQSSHGVTPPNLKYLNQNDTGPKPRPPPSATSLPAQRSTSGNTQRSNSSGKVIPPQLSSLGGPVKPEITSLQRTTPPNRVPSDTSEKSGRRDTRAVDHHSQNKFSPAASVDRVNAQINPREVPNISLDTAVEKLFQLPAIADKSQTEIRHNRMKKRIEFLENIYVGVQINLEIERQLNGSRVQKETTWTEDRPFKRSRNGNVHDNEDILKTEASSKEAVLKAMNKNVKCNSLPSGWKILPSSHVAKLACNAVFTSLAMSSVSGIELSAVVEVPTTNPSAQKFGIQFGIPKGFPEVPIILMQNVEHMDDQGDWLPRLRQQKPPIYLMDAIRCIENRRT